MFPYQTPPHPYKLSHPTSIFWYLNERTQRLEFRLVWTTVPPEIDVPESRVQIGVTEQHLRNKNYDFSNNACVCVNTNLETIKTQNFLRNGHDIHSTHTHIQLKINIYSLFAASRFDEWQAGAKHEISQCVNSMNWLFCKNTI